MRECSSRPCLAREPSAHLFIERYAERRNFDRDLPIETGVSGAKDFSHSAGTGDAFDAVRTESAARADIVTVIEEWCGRCPDRPIEDDGRGLLADQRLNFAPQRFVARTRLGHKGVSRRLIMVERQVKDSGDVLPALGSQG